MGANVFAHSQETILTLKTSMSMVKATISGCNKTKDIFYLDVDFHTLNIAPSSMFIDLSGFSSEEGSPSLVENSTMQLPPSLSTPLKFVFYHLTSKLSTSIL